MGARGQCASGRPFPHLDNVQVTLRGGHIEGSLRAALHAVSREPAHHVQVSPPRRPVHRSHRARRPSTGEPLYQLLRHRPDAARRRTYAVRWENCIGIGHKSQKENGAKRRDTVRGVSFFCRTPCMSITARFPCAKQQPRKLPAHSSAVALLSAHRDRGMHGEEYRSSSSRTLHTREKKTLAENSTATGYRALILCKVSSGPIRNRHHKKKPVLPTDGANKYIYAKLNWTSVVY